MTVQILRKKFTVAQYQQMIKAGVLTDRDRVELLQGEVIEMSPVGALLHKWKLGQKSPFLSLD
jgi:hypothetical protein